MIFKTNLLTSSNTESEASESPDNLNELVEKISETISESNDGTAIRLRGLIARHHDTKNTRRVLIIQARNSMPFAGT